MKLKKVIKRLNLFAPNNLALEWDNTGLLVGDQSIDVKNVLIALDCTKKVVDEAIKKDANLIITHHPLFINKLSKIKKDDYKGSLIYKLIKNDISVYSMHTNLDLIYDATSEVFKEKFDLIELDKVKKIDEDENGIGAILEVKANKTLDDFINFIKSNFNVNTIRYTGDENKTIKKVAIVQGSGMSFLSEIFKKDVDLFITGDIKYHNAQDSKEKGLCLIDIGHYNMELLLLEKIKKELNKNFKKLKIIISDVDEDPFKYV